MVAGRFITFEGGEGSGKSTQARRLAERLGERGIDVVATREPGGSPFAEEIRALLLGGKLAPHPALAEALLFCAARADHLQATIRPALAAGKWVICDRFADSTRVYQGAAGGVADATLRALEDIVIGETRPQLTILLDLEPAAGLARAKARHTAASEDPFERRLLEFHERLRAGYLAIATAEPERCVVVDGAQSAEAIGDQIWAHVGQRLLMEQT